MALKTLVNFGAFANDTNADTPRAGAIKLSAPFSKTYVATAQQFGGTTKEATYTNAIAAAVADGASYVLIPAKYDLDGSAGLPYNANLVTFNPAVMMFREGGPTFCYDYQAYGADPLGVLDAAASLNAVHAGINAANAGMIFVGKGTFVVATAPTSITGSVVVWGTGNQSVIQTPNNINILTLTGSNCCVRNVQFSKTGAVAAAGSTAITLDGQYATMDGVQFSNFYDAVVSNDNAFGWRIDRCAILGNVDAGVTITYSGSQGDRGDMAISNSTFDTSQGAAGSAAIRYAAHGGLKVVGTKLLHHDFNIDLSVADGVNTSDLLVTGCSLEGAVQNPVRLRRAGTTGIFARVLLTGCQLANAVSGTSGIVVNGVGAGIRDVCFTGLQMSSAGGTAIGMDLQDLDRCNIEACEFNSYTTGIKIAAAATNVIPGRSNLYYSVSTPIQDLTPAGQNALQLLDRSTRRSFSGISSTIAFTNIYQIVMNDTTYQGARIELVLEGILNGVGSFVRTVRKLLNFDAAGNVTVTAVDDIAGGQVINLQFDVATTPGSVLIGLEKPAGGTSLAGSATLVIDGHVNRVVIL